MNICRRLLAGLLLAGCASYSAAQSASALPATRAYPVKPVRFIVPFPPGGSDTIARIVATKLSDNLGQQVVVDNRAGAGGTLGTEIASKAVADGYTILFSTASFAITANLYKRLQFDPLRDFTPVTLICTGPMLLVSHPSVAARTAGDLVKLAKAKPGVLNFASTGRGSITHLAAEMFNRTADISMTHVPYKGTGPARSDLIGGQVHVMFVPLGSGLSYVRSSKLKALGVASTRRSAAAPEIPTISESGVPNFEAATWYGVLAPAGTPRQIVQKLNTEIHKVLGEASTIEQLRKLGFDATPTTSAEFQAHLKSELAKWGKVIREVGAAIE